VRVDNEPTREQQGEREDGILKNPSQEEETGSRHRAGKTNACFQLMIKFWLVIKIYYTTSWITQYQIPLTQTQKASRPPETAAKFCVLLCL